MRQIIKSEAITKKYGMTAFTPTVSDWDSVGRVTTPVCLQAFKSFTRAVGFILKSKKVFNKKNRLGFCSKI